MKLIGPSDPGIRLVLDIFATAASDDPPFPPAELFSEGWILRLVMEGHHMGYGTLPIPLTERSRWYSEARLLSPFQPSVRGDPYGEGITHADGVIGQFELREETTAGFSLTPGNQFVVIEAKMGSKLSAGTTRVPWYDQAIRNVAAMAWALHQSEQSIHDYDSLAFLITAPQQRFDVEPSFASYTAKDSLADKLARRVDLYREEDPTRYESLVRFRTHTFEPFLERLDVVLWAWEEAIEACVDSEFASSLGDFYDQCLRYASTTTQH